MGCYWTIGTQNDTNGAEVRCLNRTEVPHMSAKDTCIKNDMHSQMLRDADAGQGAFKTVLLLNAMSFAHG